MTVSDWEKEDIPEIGALERLCFSDPWSEEMLFSFFSSPYFFGAALREGGKIVGYACGSALFETAELAIVAVEKEFRRCGAGQALLREAERRAKALGAAEMLLEVRLSNKPALNLYRKNGYAEIAVRKKYYSDGEDAAVMRKSL